LADETKIMKKTSLPLIAFAVAVLAGCETTKTAGSGERQIVGDPPIGSHIARRIPAGDKAGSSPTDTANSDALSEAARRQNINRGMNGTK